MTAAIYNSRPEILTGLLTNRPLASKCKIGTIYKATNASLYMVTGSGSSKTWTDIGASGGSALSSKYWVSPSGVVPATGYTTFTAAIAAAVADDHTGSVPATICALPGGYVESFSLPDGISIFGVGGMTDGGQSSVTVAGTVTVTGTTGFNTISNMFVEGQLVVQGAASQPIGVILNNVWVHNAGTDHAFQINANDVNVRAVDCVFEATSGKTGFRCDSAGSNCSGKFVSCQFIGSGAGSGYAAQLVDSGWQFRDCGFSVTGASPAVIRGFSTSAGTAVGAAFTNCTFQSDGNASTTTCFQDTGGSASTWDLVGQGTSVMGFATASFTLLGGGGGGSVRTRGGPNLGAYVKLNLPTITLLDAVPATAYATNGTKATAAATGVPVYRDPGTSAWLTWSGDTAP